MPLPCLPVLLVVVPAVLCEEGENLVGLWIAVAFVCMLAIAICGGLIATASMPDNFQAIKFFMKTRPPPDIEARGAEDPKVQAVLDKIHF